MDMYTDVQVSHEHTDVRSDRRARFCRPGMGSAKSVKAEKDLWPLVALAQGRNDITLPISHRL